MAGAWRPAAPAFRRGTGLALAAAAVPILVTLLAEPAAPVDAYLASLAWFLMGAVIVAANVERQGRAMRTRLLGHQLMALGFTIVYGCNAVGYLLVALTAHPPQTWVYDLALIVGTLPLAIGMLRLCWPPGTTAREAWVIAGDGLQAALALMVLWILVVIPAHRLATGSDAVIALSHGAPWAQFVAVVGVVVVAAASRRPGALPVRQLILLQASAMTFICADILQDILGVRDPVLGQGALLLGAWIAALLYVLFAQRPAMEDEAERQMLLRSVWSVLALAIVLIAMGVVVARYRIYVGPLPGGAAALTLLALVLALLLVAAQRVMLAHDVEQARMLRVRAPLEESANAQWFGALLGAAHDLVTVVDRSGRIVFQTPAITSIFGYAQDALTEKHVSEIFEGMSPETMDRWLQESLHHSESEPLDMVLIDAAGEPHETETVILPLRADGADGYVLTTRDVSDRLRLRAALAESGQRDQLTGLNNRDGFVTRLRQILPGTRDHLAVALLDITNFRDINDSRGHEVGDAVLCATASAMDMLPASVVVAARIGADEFALVIVADNVERELGLVDRSLREALRRVVVDQGPALDVTFCLGYVTRLPMNHSASALMERADLALAAARTTGVRAPVKYERGMRSALVTRLRQEADLRDALDSDRLVVHYQPIIDLASGRLASVEALVRMRAQDGHLIPPDQFIPQAEELGLIGRLGLMVLDIALSDISSIIQALGRDITVAVNVSAFQIEPDLPRTVQDRLEVHRVSPRALIIEVTESSLVRHTRSADILGALRTMGCEIAIDDFGTGYSSLSYLVGLPVDELKIDRSFIGHLADSPRSLSLVRVLMQMAATLEFAVVAEGVETVEQADLLRGMGCQRAQGYLYAAPMPLDDLLDAVAGPGAAFRFTR